MCPGLCLVKRNNVCCCLFLHRRSDALRISATLVVRFLNKPYPILNKCDQLFIENASRDEADLAPPPHFIDALCSLNTKPLYLVLITITMASPEDELPTNVQSIDDLAQLPSECLSGDDERPLRHVDLKGNEFRYALQPLRYSVGLILVVELMERFAFYGVYYTQTLFLTGVYNEDWNAGFTSIDAASFVSISTAVAYTTPFIGAVLADSYLGDYKTILFGCLCLYLPGLALVALTSAPGLLGPEFPVTALTVALLVLWPLGTGIVKSVVNVFGARQFHPFLQSSLIESYYVNFYASINIGALLGILILPVVAQHHLTVAYSIPVVLLGTAVLLFTAWTPRYVLAQPAHRLFAKKRNDNDSIPLSTMFRIALLIVPFCIAYNQMPTTFIVQGTVMTKAFGFIDAATINLVDTLSVLCWGYLTATNVYPALSARNIKIPTTYKFALGSFLGVLSILWALVVETKIHHAYRIDGRQICILWQAPSYVLIGAGEIFAVSAAYEVAFTASSPQTKVLASAVNIFCVGGIPNALCIFLYQACRGWFRNSTYGDTNIQHIDDYATAHVANYFWVLVGILLFGVLLNVLPAVRDLVETTEQKAAEIVKTPLTPFLRKAGGADEETPLIGRKFGKEPVLHKMGSMREGPKIKTPKRIKTRLLKKLYHGVAERDAGGLIHPKKTALRHAESR